MNAERERKFWAEIKWYYIWRLQNAEVIPKWLEKLYNRLMEKDLESDCSYCEDFICKSCPLAIKSWGCGLGRHPWNKIHKVRIILVHTSNFYTIYDSIRLTVLKVDEEKEQLFHKRMLLLNKMKIAYTKELLDLIRSVEAPK
jgi:hypothetical protein